MSSDLKVLVSGVPHAETVVEGPSGDIFAGTALGHYLGAGPIVRIAADTHAISEFVDTGGRALGLALAPNGDLFACDVIRKELVRIDPTGRLIDSVAVVDGWELVLPNECIVDALGGVWFTDSGTARGDEPTGAILYLGSDGISRVAATGLAYPNGIGLAQSGGALYVSLTRNDALLKFEVTAPGELGFGRLVVGGVGCNSLSSGPDGLCVDDAGVVYVALTRTSRVVAVYPDQRVEVLAEDSTLLKMPSHVAISAAGTLLVPSLFGDTICELVPDRGPVHCA